MNAVLILTEVVEKGMIPTIRYMLFNGGGLSSWNACGGCWFQLGDRETAMSSQWSSRAKAGL